MTLHLCKLDPKNGITTNQSEGFNFLLKDFQSWKEVPLDSLLMSLKLIQGFYLEEIHRGKANLGTFRLKPKYDRYVQFFSQETTEQNENRTVCFCITVPCFRTTVPFFALLFRFFTTEQKRNSVFLYHCSVFALLFRFFPQLNKKRNSVFMYHGFFVFVPLFRFCTSVPFFPQLNKKRNSVFLYHCSVFSYHCSVFCNTVRFLTTEQKRNSVFLYHRSVFALLFRFFHN